MNLPPLAALRFFNVAASTMSFSETARQLNVTQAAVSRQIRMLEHSLGIELFERRNRAVFLNAAGKTLHGVTTSMFEQLENTVQRLRDVSRDHGLVVSCEPTIAMKWLIPRLPVLQQQLPELQVQLLTGGGPIEFSKLGVDLAIRRNDFHWGELIHSTPICDEWVGPVCAPQVGGASHQLDDARLLVTQSRPHAWQRWFAHQAITARRTTLVQYEHFYLCIQAAVAGQGLTMASWLMVQDELRSGQLIAPFGFSRDGSSYMLLSPEPLREGDKKSIFHRWLVEQMQLSQPLPSPDPSL